VPPDQLLALIHDADVILAPLKPNDRNCVQGCCPLKELGGMASGTPMITSALEIVEALGQSGKQFLTGRAGSAKAVKDNLLLLRTNSDWRLHLSAAARAQVEQFYAWETVTRSLIQVYEYLGLNQVPKA
jgi:glycosyltransferase involved in cell wall biosynthesis